MPLFETKRLNESGDHPQQVHDEDGGLRSDRRGLRYDFVNEHKIKRAL